MEPIFRKQYEIDTIHLDRFGRMKSSMILYFTQEIFSCPARYSAIFLAF